MNKTFIEDKYFKMNSVSRDIINIVVPIYKQIANYLSLPIFNENLFSFCIINNRCKIVVYVRNGIEYRHCRVS